MGYSMNQSAVDAPQADPAPLAGLEPIERISRRWPMILGALVSVLMILGLAHQLFEGGTDDLWRTVPHNVPFYLFFFIGYLAAPIGDYVIYRRLWRLPLAGLAALIQKRIANDVVIGYSGDLYFYVWARQRLKMVTAPFGAVKDVTILSGIVGNIVMLAMVAVVLPLAAELFTPHAFRMVVRSTIILFVITAPLLIFSRRVFSLPARQLRMIGLIHLCRIIVDSAALALAWHFAMPDVSLGMWLFLVAARLVVARMPLVPNKDLLFANFAIIFIGQGEAVGDLVAFGAALTLLVHVVLFGALGLAALIRKDL